MRRVSTPFRRACRLLSSAVVVLALACARDTVALASPLGDALPSHGGEVVANADVSAFGIRSTLTRVRYGDARPSSFGVTLAGRREGYGAEHGLILRVANIVGFGGGADGLEGQLGMAFAAGYRAPFAKSHGPFTRIGAEAFILGSPVLYHSYLELPKLELGYQYLASGKIAEAGLKAGYVAAGYYRPDDAGRPLGASFEQGAFANLTIDPLRLRATFTRVLAGAPSPALNMFEAEICSSARSLLLCSDTRIFAGEAGDRSRGTLMGSRAVVFGVTLGFSQK